MKLIVLVLIMSATCSWASLEDASRAYGSGSFQLSNQRKLIIELVDDNFYFSAIPWMKEYLVKSSGQFDSDLEKAFDEIISAGGVRAFEALPIDRLQKSRSGSVRYIIAKKLFKEKKFEAALNELSGISAAHPSYAYISHLRATILSHVQKVDEALSQFEDCVRYSEKGMSSAKSDYHKKQFEVNKDYCTAGIARVAFEKGDYSKADLLYLDIPKSSYVWPEILHEEAWNSYYLKNYNRTLGKLVSYKAPVFDFIFNPEIEVLRALTFLKMCLYNDAKATVDDFYNKLLEPSRQLRTYVLSKGKDPIYYYQLISDFESSAPMSFGLLNPLLRSISKDQAFQEMKHSLGQALKEYNQLRKNDSGAFRSALIKNLKVVIEDYRRSIGAHVRNGLVQRYAQLYRAFEGMSYIKLEVLALRKEMLYRSDEIQSKKRGDIQYIQRNEKQYFWDFNGEFWADELGDYVFALRSEC